MPFESKGTPVEHWSKEHLRLAISKVQENPIEYGDDKKRTEEKDGKFWIMGYEVLKPEYDEFMERVGVFYDHIKKDQEASLDQAA